LKNKNISILYLYFLSDPKLLNGSVCAVHFTLLLPSPPQAQARCHRIGQNKAVKVYRLITRNSYEREMFDRASLKLGLDKAVLQSMSGRDNSLGGGGGVSLRSKRGITII